MDSFNKIVSLVLGLIVVAVFLSVITGRLNLGNRFKNLFSQKKVTPTKTLSLPTLSATRGYLSPTPTSAQGNNAGIVYKPDSKNPTTIPATGSPSLLLPLFFSSLTLGFYLRRKSE